MVVDPNTWTEEYELLQEGMKGLVEGVVKKAYKEQEKKTKQV